MGQLEFRRKIMHQGGTNYVNVPPVMLDLLKARNVTEVIVSDLDKDRIEIRLVRP